MSSDCLTELLRFILVEITVHIKLQETMSFGDSLRKFLNEDSMILVHYVYGLIASFDEGIGHRNHLLHSIYIYLLVGLFAGVSFLDGPSLD